MLDDIAFLLKKVIINIYCGNEVLMHLRNEKEFIVAFTADFTFKVNIIVLMIHIGLLVMFYLGQVTILVYVNIFSIVYYIIILFFSKKHFFLFTRLTCIEVILHSMIATLVLGWEWGFELYFFAVCPIIFYFDYIAIKLKATSFKPLTSTIIVALILAITALMSGFTKSETMLNISSLNQLGLMMNALISFSFCIYFLYLYKKMALDSEQIIRTMATTDTLTNLNNRAHLLALFSESQKSLAHGTPYTIALMDVDNFKKINDTFGHTKGDEVLYKVATVLKAFEPRGMHIARWGGEEFLAYIPGTIDDQEIHQTLTQLLKEVANLTFTEKDKSFHITITIGLAKGYKPQHMDEVINIADERLYQGKNQGKNQLVSQTK